jgi:hypothetical protein
MRVFGIGLELDVALTSSEIVDLGTNDLSCNATICAAGEDARNIIPFTLSSKVEPKRSHLIKDWGCHYLTEGERYIPHSRNIFFCIGPQMYISLKEKGFAVSRFNSNGKIKLFDASRKAEVYR